MYEFSKALIEKWRKIIESINVDGFSRKVDSVNYFRMNDREMEYCYKVNFNFDDVYDPEFYIPLKWDRELEKTFIDLFSDNYVIYPKDDKIGYEFIFKNNKVDYMINQGYRFIVQFYPQGFISEARNEKLEKLGF